MTEPDPFEKTASPGLRQCLRQFRARVPIKHCAKLIGAGWKDIAVPAVHVVGIAWLDAVGLLLLIPLLGQLSGSSESLAPTALNQLTGEARFVLLVSALVASGLAKAFLSYSLHVVNGKFYQNASAALCQNFFARYLQFGRAYYQKTNRSELWSLLDKRHQLLQLFLAVQRIVLNASLLLTHLAILLLISWPLTLVLLVLFPIFHYSLKLISTRSQRKSKLASSDIQGLYPRLYSIFSNIDLYRNQCKEVEALTKLEASNLAIRDTSIRLWNLEGTVERGKEVLSLLALVLLLLVTSQLVAQKPSLLLSYLVFFFVVKNSLPLLGSFQQIAHEFTQKLPDAVEFANIFTDQDKELISEGTLVFPGLSDEIRYDSLSFSYEETKKTLDKVSFVAKAGKTTAVVGPSGSGKSTLLQLLVRSYEYGSGEILVDGTSLRSFTHRSIRGQISFLGQEADLLNATVRENLLFATDDSISDEELIDTLARVGLSSWFSSLGSGLDTLMTDHGTTISTGQRQRLALARSLLKDAAIYLFDEPASAVDPLLQVELEGLITSTLSGKTVILVTHRFEALRNVDHIVVIQDGVIRGQGSWEDLLEKDQLFKAMWEARSKP